MDKRNKIVEIIVTIIIIICIALIAYLTVSEWVRAKDTTAQSSFSEEIEALENIEDANIEENTDIIKEYTTSDGNEYKVVAVLRIPSLEIEYPVLSSTSEKLLKVSLNKYWGPNPNEIGNFCILGHNYNNSQFFSKLPNIKEGAKVYLKDMNGKEKVYTVYETSIVNPNDTSCTSQLTDGKTIVTLITCTNAATQRFIAKAVLD